MTREELHATRLYEEVKKILPDCAAVESIKVSHRAAGVNIVDEPKEVEGNDATSGDHNPVVVPPPSDVDIDTLIRQVHAQGDKWQRDEIEAATNAALTQERMVEQVRAAKIGASLRARQLEECLARVDDGFNAADNLEKEFRAAEESRFAKEKADLAARTKLRMEQARQRVQLADDSAARRAKVQQFLDLDTKSAELVFHECVERQNHRKDEEARRLVIFKSLLDSRIYAESIVDLRKVVNAAWMEGVSESEQWKQWAARLGQEINLGTDAVAAAVAATPRKSAK